MRRQFAIRARRTAWQLALALLAFLQVVATFKDLTDRLYVAKWIGGVAVAVCFFALGHFRVSTNFARELSLVMAMLAIGLISQLGDTLDARAVAIATSYTLTASVAFLLAPSALRRRSVQRLVWPAMLLGATAGVLLGEYIGFRNPLGAVWSDQDRWRFAGGFALPNAAGTAGLIGVILAVAAFMASRRWLYLVPIAPLVLVMTLADSRGSLLAAGTFVAIPVVVRVARWRTRLLAIVSCVGILVLLGLGMLFSNTIEWPDTSHTEATLNRVSTGRWENWTESLGYLGSKSEWIFGLGLSRNLSFVGRETTAIPVPVRGSNADNFYVDLLGRAGLAGLLLFACFIGLLAVRLCRGLRHASPRGAADRALGLAVLAATLALGTTNSVILTWGWLQAMVAWPLVTAAATRPVYPARVTQVDAAT